MARRGERKVRTRAAAPSPPPSPGQIGIRSLLVPERGREKTVTLDPGAYRCSVLVAQLADEWLKLARGTALRSGGQSYAHGVRNLARFVDKHLPTLGLDPQKARLDGDTVDLVAVLYAWEAAMREESGAESGNSYDRATSVLALIANRAAWDGAVPESLRLRAQARPAFRKPPEEPLDEFSNAERIALRDASRAAIRAMEERLSWGRELLEAGVDPRQDSWRKLENLVWAARFGLLNSAALTENLPAHPKWWPRPLHDVMLEPSPDGKSRRPGIRQLGRGVGRLLFPDDMDLHPFRVLMLLGMADTTPEELNDLKLGDLEAIDGGLRVVQSKFRAGRTRADLHPATEAGEYFAGAGAWDVPGLFRRLLAATELSREVFADVDPWLMLEVTREAKDGSLKAGVCSFKRTDRRFTHWIAQQRDAAGKLLEISEPHDARRLRKTAKVVRATVLGGTVSDLAGDDHHVEVYRNHYAHGTTAHILAGRAVNRAQEWVFGRTIQSPVLVAEEAEKRLEDAEVAADLGLEASQAKAMLAGELDMGLVNCRDPYDSPHSARGKVCHVAPAMCMLCRNAVVFTSQLPRLLMLADHIERMRAALDPPRWQAVWGRQAAALNKIFAECGELLPAARREIDELGLRLDLPLGQRTEFDR
ncbi:hypothetical protein [Streptomyces sp. NRRL S-920]|uniref:hypothetical protein n=1 Tax=Streptomyces sp. NRRL S-920 TaxID=1463921 RepID=UPI0004CA1C5A|nr:hypothetical protein [Streptomyces sp. NRRL S-920]